MFADLGFYARNLHWATISFTNACNQQCHPPHSYWIAVVKLEVMPWQTRHFFLLWFQNQRRRRTRSADISVVISLLGSKPVCIGSRVNSVSRALLSRKCASDFCIVGLVKRLREMSDSGWVCVVYEHPQDERYYHTFIIQLSGYHHVQMERIIYYSAQMANYYSQSTISI